MKLYLVLLLGLAAIAAALSGDGVVEPIESRELGGWGGGSDCDPACNTDEICRRGNCIEPECRDDDDCSDDEKCKRYRCVDEDRECYRDWQCDDDEKCDDGHCVDDSSSSSSSDECWRDWHCDDDEKCEDGHCVDDSSSSDESDTTFLSSDLTHKCSNKDSEDSCE